MELKLKYRDNDFFNDNDLFAFYDSALKSLFSSKVHFEKGNWWTNKAMKYKCTSILSAKIK